MTRVRASGVGVGVRRVDALASLARWLPRSVAPAPWSQVGAVSTGFGSPAIPWHVIAREAEEQPPATDDDRRSSRHPGSEAASGFPSAPVRRGTSVESTTVALRGIGARGSASAVPGSVGASTTVASVFSGDRNRSLEPDGSSGHAGRPDALGSDQPGMAVPRTAGTPEAYRRPGPSTSIGRHQQPVPREAVTFGVADHRGSKNGLTGPAANDGTTAPRGGRSTNPERSMLPGRIDDLEGRDEPYDTELPVGALGELVRRWGGPPATGPILGDVDDGDRATIRRAAPDVEFRHPTATTTAWRPGRRPPAAEDAPAADEHLLDVIDVALTELLRRDAERHGLGGLLP